MSSPGYRGRFAPSPTGPLHLGSLVAALASWLDARAHGGQWLVRIEDIDPPREDPGATRAQLAALSALGLAPDQAPTFQSAHADRYLKALSALLAAGHAYRCACSRAAVELQARRAGLPPHVYPGTCRDRPATSGPASLRVRVPGQTVRFVDRACGAFCQQLEIEVGDFVVRRADGLWTYQLAAVVDDGAQQITDVVRGADLLDNTPRQIHLQHLLQIPTPRYLHVPLVLDNAGEKLSKQTGAAPLDLSNPVGELERAWRHLGFAATGTATAAGFLSHAVQAWQARWCRPPGGADRIEADGASSRPQPATGPIRTR